MVPIVGPTLSVYPMFGVSYFGVSYLCWFLSLCYSLNGVAPVMGHYGYRSSFGANKIEQGLRIVMLWVSQWHYQLSKSTQIVVWFRQHYLLRFWLSFTNIYWDGCCNPCEANIVYIMMQVAAEINGCGGKAFYRQVDVTDKAQVSYLPRFKKENCETRRFPDQKLS